MEIPVIDHEDPFILGGVWVSLSEMNFMQFQNFSDTEKRSQYGPYFGWLSAHLTMYADTGGDTENLKTRAHIRDDPLLSWKKMVTP